MVRLRQVEKNLLGQNAMAGSSGREKQHGIFFADRIGFFDLAKKFCRIGELGLEVITNFPTHFVTTTVNARADCGLEIAGTAAETTVHLADSFLRDPFERAVPAGVKYTYGPAVRVDKDDGQAIRGLNTEQQTRCVSDESVAGEM